MDINASKDLSGKKVLVLGLGIQSGGVEAVKFLARAGAEITVSDLRSRHELKRSLGILKKFKGIRYHLGGHREADLRNTDYILKNPGIPPDSPYLRRAQKLKIPILTDIGIFFKFCPAVIIGVTGTRGKSTVAYLIYSFLRSTGTRGRKVFLAGNIGKSALSLLSRVRKDDIVVLELSSFQLHDLAPVGLSPKVAVITNIFSDHLNWHKDFASYLAAKRNIVAHQRSGDLAFINGDDRSVLKIVKNIRSRVIKPGLPEDLGPVVDRNLGGHYRKSVALALAVGKHFGAAGSVMRKVLRNFRGLPGRQEIIRRLGINFVNDTTATMPDAAIAALDRFSAYRVKGAKLILIAGGSDKKLDFRILAGVIPEKADALILLPGSATEKILQKLGVKGSGLKMERTMARAVKTARSLAGRGDWVVLSPGAASFGLFLNEFDRGDQFIKEISKLK